MSEILNEIMRPIRCAALLLVPLGLGCTGDRVGPDQAPLCVAAAFDTGEPARVMAVMHGPEDDAAIIVGDAPLVDGRGCVTLRPPPPAWIASLTTAPQPFEPPHAVGVLDPVLDAQGNARPFDFEGVLIDLAVYVDGDGSGSFEAPDAAGVGPDRLLTRLSASDWARLPIWFSAMRRQLDLTPDPVLPPVLATLAPGHQPFAVTAFADAPRAWRGADEPLLEPWPAELTLPPTAAGTWCDIGSAWPRCRAVDDRGAFVEARLVDPRVPAEQVTRPADGFDPVVPLPPADAPVEATVQARQCADVGPYRVARERTFVPRQEEASCVCTVYVRTRWVIALADDPPEWLVCGGRPLSAGAGAALAAEAGLARQATRR